MRVIGGEAFAIENIKTVLLHGAKHLTVVHRSDFQVWLHCVHYLLSSERNRIKILQCGHHCLSVQDHVTHVWEGPSSQRTLPIRIKHER